MKEILLVDDHRMIREAIKLYLEGNEDFKIVDEADNGSKAYEMLIHRTYDIVITDLSMPDMDGVDLVRKINANYPKQPVIVLSMDNSSTTIKSLIDSGVKSYLLKNITRNEFIKALEVVSMGGKYFYQDLDHKQETFSIGKQIRNFNELSIWKKFLLCGRLVVEGASIFFF